MIDRVGQQLGNYQLVRLLGRGGQAEVYLGDHRYLKSQAAIKVLHTRLAKEGLAEFLAEARSLVQLIHPSIVRVLDFGVENEIPFLVMDYAPHGTLRDHHPRGTRLSLPTIVSYVTQVAAALQHAHDAHLVHRDIKPENMLLGRNHEVLLSDFGLAVLIESSGTQNTQEMAGTAPYMAPEQFQGKPQKASDQYALGVVVYEWICGACPFHGSVLEIATQHLYVPPPSLREKHPAVLPSVEEVVMAALAKEPQQRFVSVRAFATALAQACHTDPEGHIGLSGMSPVEEKSTSGSEPHAQHNQGESIYWTVHGDAIDSASPTNSTTLQDNEDVGISSRPNHTATETASRSVFLFNEPLTDPWELYGRARERETLLNRTYKGASTSIIGPRRIGKTWLISYLGLVAQKELGARFRIGYLDATLASCATVPQFAAKALEVLNMHEYTASSAFSGLAALENGVRDLKAQSQNPVLCIDEFEGFNDRYVFDLHFFTALRAMTQIGLCLVVVSKSPLIDLVGDYGKTSGFFNVFEQLTIKPFSFKEAERFVHAKGTLAHFTDQERMLVLHYGQHAGEYWPVRLQLVGKMLLEDKRLALKEQDADYYRPHDPSYWQEFEKRLEETYRGVVQ